MKDPSTEASQWQSAVWTAESIDRFWEFQAGSPIGQSMSFARRNGKGVVRALMKSEMVHPGDRLLDFGCGAGHLSPYLLDAGFEVWGVDSSADLVKMINHTNNGVGGWHGAQTDSTSFESEMFDVVVCVEVVEHLLDGHLEPMLEEIKRVLRPGGVALFTTPNNENIEGAHTCCPFCFSVFHYRQHLRNFDRHSLSKVLSRAGLNVKFCSGLSFLALSSHRPGWRDWNYRAFRSALRSARTRVGDRYSGRSGLASSSFQQEAKVADNSPHLCAIAVKI